MPKATSKTSAQKKAMTKPAKAGPSDAKKTPAPAPAPRQSAEKKAVAPRKVISDEHRYRMIAEAAYFRAESHHFKGDPVRDWIEAERDIALLLGEDK